MLSVDRLTKIDTPRKGRAVRALDGVSLEFPEKGLVFLLGRSGSGKTTLLNILGGIDTPSYGEMSVDGRSFRDFSSSDLDAYRNSYVGFVFQEYDLYPNTPWAPTSRSRWNCRVRSRQTRSWTTRCAAWTW